MASEFPDGYKPLGTKSYGSIPHLPGSRVGPGDHTCHPGQRKIATLKPRDKYDEILLQEKLDGSNVGVARLDDRLFALSRSGYLAATSPYEQHHVFARWVEANAPRFLAVLRHGERLCGEWLMQAHGTRYQLSHEPFVCFDLMLGQTRLPYDLFLERIRPGDFISPHLLHRGAPVSIEDAIRLLGTHGFHGALDPAEGVVWRVERDGQVNPNSSERRRKVDFLVKYVRPDKVDGCYLPDITGGSPVYNWMPPAAWLDNPSET